MGLLVTGYSVDGYAARQLGGLGVHDLSWTCSGINWVVCSVVYRGSARRISLYGYYST